MEPREKISKRVYVCWLDAALRPHEHWIEMKRRMQKQRLQKPVHSNEKRNLYSDLLCCHYSLFRFLLFLSLHSVMCFGLFCAGCDQKNLAMEHCCRRYCWRPLSGATFLNSFASEHRAALLIFPSTFIICHILSSVHPSYIPFVLSLSLRAARALPVCLDLYCIGNLLLRLLFPLNL